ncbi:MAG TPA: L,D-transpeptidase family protein [Anaerolineales bacterium]|nr:L,D-transpeptidase family protein [Anaerolineales bacterium]
MLNPQITRRDFLKLASAGTLAFALKDLKIDRALAASPVTQGCMTISGVPLYDAPLFTANKIHHFGKDEVVDVTSVVENGDPGNPFNNTWYRINEEGFTYSGWVYPVETKYQKPTFTLPEKGQLGEVTVPFTDVKLDPYVYAKRGYRLYYRSTHWVKKVVVTREEKSIWYQIYDFHLRKYFYVPSYTMRLVPNDELTPLSPEVPNEEKHIIVDLASQMVTAFEGEKLVLSQRCSSGAKGTETPTGEFRTYHKGPSVHMTNQGDALENIFNLPGVPWCSFFTGIGNAFHGAYWHNDYGRPRSHGCVNLPADAAKFLYRWTSPIVPPDADYVHLPGEGTRAQII